MSLAMNVRAFWNLSQFAHAIMEMPTTRAIGARTVIVRRERMAHALRRHMVDLGSPETLCGLRFITPIGAAIETLRGSGIAFSPGEEAHRATRLRVIFRHDLALRHYPISLLQYAGGWDDAFAQAIGEFEALGLRPEDLPTDDPQCSDLASLWTALDVAAAQSWSQARILNAAAAVLKRSRHAWPFSGPTLALASGHDSCAYARFLRAIPHAEVAFYVVRPLRSSYLTRLERLFGSAAAAPLLAAREPHAAATERDRLATHLFGPPEPHQGNPDGTVDIEIHPSTEAELQSTADWVVREVVHHGTALEDLAILLPEIDPLASLVVARLERLPFSHGETLPIYVAGGLPLWETPNGLRAMAALRTLEAGDAPHELKRALAERHSLSRLVAELGRFFEQQVAPDMATWLRERTSPLCREPTDSMLTGVVALEAIKRALLADRVNKGRFGDGAIYVGTVRDAVGIDFRAARFIGLVEGVIPSSPRTTPVITPSMNARVGRRLLLRSEDRALGDLHSFDLVVRNTHERVSFSASVVDFSRRQREPSPIFVEIASALGRSLPLQPQSRASALPEPWQNRAPLTPVGDNGQVLPIGATPSNPLSASGLRLLLECPYRFLLTRICGFREPEPLRSAYALDALTYGKLFHRAVEFFYRDAGHAFGRREHSLDHWTHQADSMVERAYNEQVQEGATEKQREPLRRNLHALLQHDWNDGRPRTFVDVERPFGVDAPVRIDVADTALYVRGTIDRLDVEDGTLLIRDIKTGHAPKTTATSGFPTPTVDAQIALYGLVARTLASRWGLPNRIAVSYVYVRDRSVVERAFRADFSQLEADARSWFHLAARLIVDGQFPRSPNKEDCRTCPFQPVCGSDAPRRAQEHLAGVGGVLADFRTLKQIHASSSA